MSKKNINVSKKETWSIVTKYMLDNEEYVSIEYRFPCEHLRSEFVKLLKTADVGLGFCRSSEE